MAGRLKTPKVRSVSIDPNEIIFPTSQIIIETDVSVDTEYAQGIFEVHGIHGNVKLKNNGRQAIWIPLEPMSPGKYKLTINTTRSSKRKNIAGPNEIPFVVSDSRAKIPKGIRVRGISRLVVGRFSTKRIPIGKQTKEKYVEFIKAESKKTGKPVDLAYDSRGRRINGNKLLLKIEKERLKKFGKLHESLFWHLNKVKSNASIDVVIWLRVNQKIFEPINKIVTKSNKIPRQEIKMRQQISKITKIYEDKIRRFKPRKLERDEFAPVIYATLKKTDIIKLAKNKEISAIFLHETKGIDDLDDSISIANSDDVHSTGNKGSGVKVAVWENGPDDTGDLVINSFYDPAQSNKSEHSRHTHAIVKNKESGKPKGHAPSCILYSANNKKLGALHWAVKTKGCTVVSQSFHRDSEPKTSSLSFDDIYKDWLVLQWPYPTILQAAGNYWNGDYDDIDPPSDEYVNHKGYNSLAVGNHNDNATAMSGSSVFRNPSTSHNDRELPEISANGICVTTVGLEKSGTSMASPAVAGITALLQNQSSTLKSWPEGCRAILLAGARRNISGNTWWNDVSTGNDASDGSGAVDAEESIDITKRRRSRNASATQRGWDVGTLSSNNFGTDKRSNFSYKIKVPTNGQAQHVKVALTWNSKIEEFSLFGISIPVSSKLDLDFDLMVYDSSNNLVGYSGSWDNSYEITEFDGIPGQTYTIKIRRWSGTRNTWYGIAWTVT